jgi:hypothetical protein
VAVTPRNDAVDSKNSVAISRLLLHLSFRSITSTLAADPGKPRMTEAPPGQALVP